MRRLVCLVLLLSGCATYRDDLNRGQRLYLDTQYDQALATWRVLEPDLDSLTPSERTRYGYLRGMTDYRLGFRQDARHWLAVAKATNEAHPGGLEPDAQSQLDRVLNELNEEVYAALQSQADEAQNK